MLIPKEYFEKNNVEEKLFDDKKSYITQHGSDQTTLALTVITSFLPTKTIVILMKLIAKLMVTPVCFILTPVFTTNLHMGNL